MQLELPQALEQEIWEAVKAYEQEQAMPYVSSVERIGLERGRQEGAQQQAYRSLLHILQHRFKLVPVKLKNQLQKLTIAQMESAITTALAATSIQDFADSLPQTKQSSARKATRKKASDIKL